MPMIKDAAPPLSQDRIRELRSQLSADYGHAVVTDNGVPVLVVRVPSQRPDFLVDVDRAAEVVSEDEVRAAKDILLIGGEKIVRVDPIPLRDKIRERAREEAPFAVEMRNQLNRAYGIDIMRPQGIRGPAVLGVRIPRARAAEIADEDRAQLRATVEEALKQTRDVSKVFLIADQDFRTWASADFARVLRGEAPVVPAAQSTPTLVAGSTPGRKTTFSGSPFGGLIGEAIETDQRLKAQKAAKGGKPDAAASAAPSLTPVPPAPVRLPPSMADGPFGGLLSAAATPPAPTPPTPPKAEPAPAPQASPVEPVDPIQQLSNLFRQAGYECAPAAKEVGFDLAAHKEGGKKLLVKKVPTLDLLLGRELAKKADELGADAVVVITDAPAAGTRSFAMGSKLEIVKTGDVAGLEL